MGEALGAAQKDARKWLAATACVAPMGGVVCVPWMNARKWLTVVGIVSNMVADGVAKS